MSDELVYVSWGGTGRGVALRAAYEEAAQANQSLTYLAILDPPHFADLDRSLLALVVDELEWLLNAHMRTVAEASSRQAKSTRVLVRTGEVDDEVEHLVQATGAETIIIGAPLDLAGNSVDELVDALQARTGAAVRIIDPDGVEPLT